MASAVSVTHRADRAALIQKVALVRQVRRLADELESLSCQFEKTGALSAIRRFMELHEEGNPNFDMFGAAKNLRSYAGVLSLLTSPKAEPIRREKRSLDPRLIGRSPKAEGSIGSFLTGKGDE